MPDSDFHDSFDGESDAGLDAQLTAAVRGAARTPAETDGAGLATQVAAKRAHRRRVRQARAGALAVAAVVAVVVASVAIVGGSDGGGNGGSGRRQVAAGGNGGTPTVRVVDGDTLTGPLRAAGRGATVAPITLSTAEGYLRGPLQATGDLVTATAYNPSGNTFTFPPSAIVRFTAGTGQVTDRVDLQGEIQALSDGEGARFAQTRDKTVTGPQDPEFRVKRITADDQHVSNPIPPPNHPAGPIVAGGGAVWVPVTDGVLRFDPATGAYEGKVPLPTVTFRRGIALLGKGAAYVTDGGTIRRLDPGSDATPAPDQTLPLPPTGSLLDVVAQGNGGLALARDAHTGGALLVRFGVLPGVAQAPALLPLPAGVEATALHTSNGVTWVDATIGAAPVALVLGADGTRVEHTIVLLDTADQSLTFTSRTSGVLTSGGVAYRITL